MLDDSWRDQGGLWVVKKHWAMGRGFKPPARQVFGLLLDNSTARPVKWTGVLLALVLSTVVLGDDFPDLNELMTAEEYEAAGLDKLNTEERAALEEWLVRYTAHDAQRVKKSSKRVKTAQAKPMEDTLVGEFEGWRGRTVFRFVNGEVWRQTGNEQYYPRKKLMNPAVEIHRGLIGGYQLELVETGARVKVERIK